jgi:arylsulfatase A-like enzyme
VRPDTALVNSPTLASVLREHHFETIAFTGGAFVSGTFGLDRGFHLFHETVGQDARRRRLALPRRGAPAEDGPDFFDRGIAYLAQRPSSPQPFFLFLHTYGVHDYVMFRECRDPPQASLPHELRHEFLHCQVWPEQCNAAEWQHIRERYDAEVEELDRQFGRLLDALRSRGWESSTLIVFTSDHGEGFDPGRRRVGHGGRLHEDLIRIPLLIAGPGVPPGDMAEPVSLVDVMPAVLQTLGVPAPPDLDGRPLPFGGEGPAQAPPRALYASDHQWWRRGREILTTPPADMQPFGVATIWGDLWYVAGVGGEELYDMGRDPLQRHDLASQHPALDGLRSLAARHARNGAAIEPVAVDPAVEERLRALGYN